LYDPCLLYNREAVVALQTDDTLFLGNTNYITIEETELKKAGYFAKPIDELSTTKNLTFNRGLILRDSDRTVYLSQKKQCEKIKIIKSNSNLKSSYIQERARGAYIASTYQPEAVFSLSFAA